MSSCDESQDRYGPTPGSTDRLDSQLGADVIVVTSLDDSGPGSLRAAIEQSGPRTIVFEVGGVIPIEDTLTVSKPYATIAGETAPSPGITLVGGRLVIKTHDVVMRHIRLRVGEGTGFSPDNRDGIIVVGRDDGRPRTYRVLIENCSVSWAIDENISVWNPGTHDITVRHSIISEALSHSLHPKGEHSMGLLAAKHVRDVHIVGNLFAHNRRRNPAVGYGASAIVLNNLIYNPGALAMHIYGDKARHPERRAPVEASIVGNLVIPGPDTAKRLKSGSLPLYDAYLNPGTRIFLRDNIGPDGAPLLPQEEARLRPGFDPIVEEPPIWDETLEILPAASLEQVLLDTVGARPWDRDDVDRRIIAEVRSRQGKIIDSPRQVETSPRVH